MLALHGTVNFARLAQRASTDVRTGQAVVEYVTQIRFRDAFPTP